MVTAQKVQINNPRFSIQKPNVILMTLQKTKESELDVSAQNLANAMHPGFKEFIVSSIERVFKTKDKKKISTVGSSPVTRNLGDGPINMTGNRLDFAISGSGYFMVRTDKGTRYTRNGRFTIDNSGQLLSATGHPVLNQTGSEIILPKGINSFNVSRDGTIFLDGNVAGKLGVAAFQDEDSAHFEGSSLIAFNAEPINSPNAVITQGGYEESNVSITNISMKLISLMHRFEEAQLLIKQYEELQKQTLNASAKNV